MNQQAQQSNVTYLLNMTATPEQAKKYADALSELFGDDPPAISLFEKEEGGPWDLSVYFESEPERTPIEQALAGASSPVPGFTLELMPQVDWVSHVQSELKPVSAGRFFIHGSHDRHKAARRSGDIEIEAGQAFGTAHHATTRGCLLALDHLFKSKSFCNILDLGTGTGLLAIAVAKVLKRPVLASDIDPTSVRIATENAEFNQVGPLVQALRADGLKHPVLQAAAPYDLLIANILAAPLSKMAPDIKAVLCPGSHLVLSGLLITQSPSIEARYRNLGFRVLKRLPQNQWMTLILRLDH